MATKFTAAQATAFREWVWAHRPMGFAVTDRQVAVGAADGTSWVAGHRDTDGVRQMLALLRDRDVPVWMSHAGLSVRALVRQHDQSLEQLEFLNCASTAQAVVHPGAPSWLSSRKGRPTTPAGAARQAVAAARVMVGLQEAPNTVRVAVMNSVALEKSWRHIQVRGMRVNVDFMDAQLVDHARLQQLEKRELGGLDLLDESDAGRTATHAWLQGHGIHMADREGNPSLSRDHQAGTTVPASDAAQWAWMQFKRVRHIGSRQSTLRQVRREVQNGRLHPEMVLHHAVTGRSVVLRPALQATTAALKPLLQADPGHVLVSLDLSQVEPRVAAGLSGDEALKADLLSGDIYENLAVTVRGESARGDTELRDLFKTGFLATMYGQGANGLSRALDCSKADAAALIASIHAAYPRLDGFTAELKTAMLTGDPDLTVAGRPLPVIPAGQAYKVLNSRLQSTAADLFFAGVGRVADELGPETLWLAIHDEIIVHVPDRDSVRAVEVLEQCMATVLGGVPIGGKATVLGGAWASA